MDKKFSIEYQYQLYLKRVGLKESKMSPIQAKETRQAFYAACGQTLLLMRDDIAEIEDEDEGIKVLESLLNEIKVYFANITAN